LPKKLFEWYRYMKINRLIDSGIYPAIILLSLTLVGWGDSWEQIKKGASNISSVRAEFTQTKRMEILSKPLVSKGKLYFQAPGSLRWEYSSPVWSVLLMHDRSIRRYVKRGDAVVEDSAARLQSMKVVIQEIALWMKGDFDANPAFRAKLRPGRTVILEPKEKAMADIIMKIELKLSDTPGVIRSVTIYESEKSYTVLAFSKVALNDKIPETAFRKM
jgi:outer membrane lipoprotein-sorting protein